MHSTWSAIKSSVFTFSPRQFWQSFLGMCVWQADNLYSHFRDLLGMYVFCFTVWTWNGFLLLKISSRQPCWSSTEAKHCLWRANLPLWSTQLWTCNVVIQGENITTHQCNNTHSSSDYAIIRWQEVIWSISFPCHSVTTGYNIILNIGKEHWIWLNTTLTQ